MHLTFAKNQQVFTSVRKILQPFGGVWITPDLVVTQKAGIGKMRQDPAASSR
ncbi:MULTISPECIES: hypothetical protein [Nostoc]|uniref:Uncharacterized protein n=1 Tax=Nostoc paludosum FACHB-159 TaxID=2692908 RepID=A0ABR8KA09_9NOSO|nr:MULTISPECIES: hypothetical protein [Nostoc]MBD2679183.1 hypothetical protein [Nostoc sp. FACHB-857]MBD2735564.1 hypothetical protein [Nostoc paludosum FACHB-159]